MEEEGIGYDREKKVEIQHLDSQVDETGQLYIEVESTRSTHIKSGILYNRLKKVGKIERYRKHIKLNSDKKRFWFDELKSLTDTSYCDSAPLNANLVADIIAKVTDIEWHDQENDGYEPESDV